MRNLDTVPSDHEERRAQSVEIKLLPYVGGYTVHWHNRRERTNETSVC